MATSLSSIRKNGVLLPGNLPVTTTIPVAQVSDAGTTGKVILLSDTPSLARSAMGLGSAATSAITDFATTAQGIKADNAIPTSAIGTTVAGLTGGKLLASVLPSIAVVDYLGSVASQAAMLALVGQRGDWCIRSDLGTTWIITGDTPTSISSWTQLSYPATGGSVTSVAGKTGVVTLTTADISGLGSAALLNATSLVTTVAGRSGAVTLSTADISGLGTAATLNATSLVTTVAGRSGAVTLSTADITGLGTAATAASTDFATAAQGVLATNAIPTSAIGTTVAGLTGGKLSVSVIPSIAIVEYLGVAAGQAEMLALTGQKGDWCIRTDLGTNWIITGDTPSLISSWTQLSYPATGSSVSSVAGRTGSVILQAADISDASTLGLDLLKASTQLLARGYLGLGTASTLNSTAIVQSVNGVTPDGAGNVSTNQVASGTVGATEVIIPLVTYNLVGKPHLLVVSPDSGCTISIAYSTDGGSVYTTYVSTSIINKYQYLLQANETAVTHVRLTRTVGSTITSTYSLIGGVDLIQYPISQSTSLNSSAILNQAVIDSATVTGVNLIKATDATAVKTIAGLNYVNNTGGTSGGLSTTPTVVDLATFGLYNVSHILVVSPVNGATVTIQYSTDGGTVYSTLTTTTTTAMYPYVILAGDTAITHLKLTASTGTTSTYMIR